MGGRTRFWLGVASAAWVAACGTAPAAPGDVIHIAGMVRDTDLRPIPDVRVEIASGQFFGHFTMSGADGRFQFFDPPSIAEPVTLSFLKPGYVTGTVAAWRNQPLTVTMAQAPKFLPPGDYSFTFTAGAECAPLPAAVRTRTYLGTINEPTGPSLGIELRGADFYPSLRRILATTRGSTIQFTTILDAINEDGNLAERLSATEHVLISGTATASEHFERVDATLSGTFTYCPSSIEPATAGANPRCRLPVVACTSERHRLTVARR